MVRYPAVHQACSINQSMISALITIQCDGWFYIYSSDADEKLWMAAGQNKRCRWVRQRRRPCGTIRCPSLSALGNRAASVHLAFCCRARNHTGWPIRKGDSNLVVVGSHPKRTISNLIWTSVLFRSLLWMFFKNHLHHYLVSSPCSYTSTSSAMS